MAHYHNESNPYAARWLRNLIGTGLLPAGEVDERSIVDVQPDDLLGFTQCHFFAGIGGWSLAARLAGWPDDRELWTGSCPCQPFSVAGRGKAQADERHLWPEFFRLIRAGRPAAVVGEQVAAAAGKDWLDGVLADLESINYVGGAAIVPACAVDAPHRRDRLWFVAHSGGTGLPLSQRPSVLGQGWRQEGRAAEQLGGPSVWDVADSSSRGPSNRDARTLSGERVAERQALESERRCGETRHEGCGDVGHADHESAGRDARTVPGEEGTAGRNVRGFDHGPSHAGRGCDVAHGDLGGSCQGPDEASSGHRHAVAAGGRSGAWAGAGWIIGHDGKARRVEPSIRLLADGVPGRVGRLRAYGNAIVPQVAAEIIAAFMECAP